jgi:hypothetical protein
VAGILALVEPISPDSSQDENPYVHWVASLGVSAIPPAYYLEDAVCELLGA